MICFYSSVKNSSLVTFFVSFNGIEILIVVFIIIQKDTILGISSHNLMFIFPSDYVSKFIIWHNIYNFKVLFLSIFASPNRHVTEKPFDPKHIQVKNNGAKFKCSQSEFIIIWIKNIDWLNLNFALLFFGWMCFRTNGFSVTWQFEEVEIKKSGKSEL